MIFLKRIFAPPHFPQDEPKNRQAFLLNIILWTLVAIPIPYVIYAIAVSDSLPQNLPRALREAAFGEVVNIFLLWLMHRGWVQAAAITQVTMFWLFFTVVAFTGNQIQGVSYLLGYSLVICIAGVLISSRAAFVMTLLSVLSGLGMLYSLSVSKVANPPLDDPGSTWLLSAIIFPVMAILQYLNRYTLSQTLKQAQQEIDQRKRIEQQLQESLIEKELLLKEVHHRVKNNMQVIVSLLSLQAAGLNEPTTINLLRDSQNRVRSMALVHEKLYQSNNLAQIDLRDYLQHLATTLFHSYSPQISNIELIFKIEALTLSIDQAIPCGLIANELISNALKHAFPNHRAGKVQIGLIQTSERAIQLYMENDGVDFPANLDFRQTESLGMQLILSLTRQLNGHLELTRLTPGTRFTIYFENTTPLT
jgi:two-component sensor histidine kinase